MGYPITLRNSTKPLRFILVLSTDHITGAEGKIPTVVIAKSNSVSFATPAGAITELGNGWYQIAGNAVDASVLGPLSLHATCAGCDPDDEEFYVVNW